MNEIHKDFEKVHSTVVHFVSRQSSDAAHKTKVPLLLYAEHGFNVGLHLPVAARALHVTNTQWCSLDSHRTKYLLKFEHS